jgi:hypothetical protein
VANVAVSTPMGLDSMIDILSFAWSTKNSIFKGNIRLPLPDPKLLLILSLMLPNIFILLLSVPTNNVDLINSFFGARVILILYGFSIQIWIYGESHLKSIWFVIGYFLMTGCIALMTLDSYSVFKAPQGMFFIEVSFFSLGATILSIIFIRWILSLKSIGYDNISQSQKDNLSYVIIFGIFGISLLLVTAIYISVMGYFDANFYITISYLEGMVSVSLIIFENRAAKSDFLSMKDVSKI